MGLMANLKGDWATLKAAVRTLELTKPIAENPSRVFPVVVEELAATFGDAPALLSERETFSYRELNARANRYARWALARGLAKGDTVCLMMPSRPEYMAVWLGITRAGGAVALINTNLTGQSLAHCIDVVAPKHVIVTPELLDALMKAAPLIRRAAEQGEGPARQRRDAAPAVWLHGEADAELPRIDRDVEGRSGEALAVAERPALTIEDRALYIYTSGTTGLPKAANINHYRLMLGCFGFAGIMETRASDRMYGCLPMYHTTGGVVATGAVLVRGGAVAIRERFSAREFWDDVVRFDCTMVQYVGELCRYLVNAPPHPNETRHRLRLATGNGLRPDVWPAFKQRFRIPQILEFYAATEGNVSLFNFEGKEGAVGRLPWFLVWRYPVKVVRFDVEAERPVRDANGLCIECPAGEIGEVIGQILEDPAKPGARFEGYATAAETERKILRNAFAQGDAWFRTGDLMRRDARGHFYFVDRIGDTFRWKGENVATCEVAETLTLFPGVNEANVYGVKLEGREGRAGMAALVVDVDLDLGALRAFVAERLPPYAQPLFLRLGAGIEVTATFKQKKIDLVRQGFDPAATDDPLFFNDPQAQAFVRIDVALYARIESGEVRL